MVRRFLIGGILLAIPMGMLYPLWRCPTSAGEDDVIYYYPMRTLVAQQLRGGQWPAWNPYEAGGVPLLGDPQSGLLYPSNLLFLCLPSKLAYSLAVFLAFALAGGGAWLYLRRIGLVAAAAAFGSAAFMFGGFMVAHRVHLSLIQAAALLPWGMWCVELTRRSGWRALAWMTPIFALTLAAGHWPTAIHMTLAWAAYLAFRGRPFGRAVVVAVLAAAMGTAVMAPQIAATAEAIGGTIRAGVPYAVAGENSFFPLCGVLAFFPFIMGSRTPNLFPQQWWGPWHLCEMLGYVGLVTLVLAGGAIWRLYRKHKRVNPEERCARAIVRVWLWLLIGAGIWALGYYLPSYRLIHKLPLVGTVRCPARMLLVIDLGLATLAAMAIHALATGRPGLLGRTVRRAATLYLPACMAFALALLGGLYLMGDRWRQVERLLVDLVGIREIGALAGALDPASAAVWVPLALAAGTIFAVRWFLRSPGKRAWALTAMLLVDLFFITRFVDVPGPGQPLPDPHNSPAARWLADNAPADEPYRVWSPTQSYRRPIELLAARSCATLGIETISYYGPFQPAAHPRLLGPRSWGENYEWAWLIRRNHLLSLFNVRYILVPDTGEYRDVIERVVVSDGPPRQPGPNLLAGPWQLSNARQEGGVLRLRRPMFSLGAEASQAVTLTGEVYRISLDARAPEGAANLLCAEYVPNPDDPPFRWDNPGRMRIDCERLGPKWRHFEWTFQAPLSAGGEGVFRIFTYSEKPVEVRNVSLRRGAWETPINLADGLKPGQRVYVDLTGETDGLPPLKAGDPRIHVYKNLLCLPRSFPVGRLVALEDDHAVVEALRWRPDEFDLARQALVGGDVDLGEAKSMRFISENLVAKAKAVGGDVRVVRANGLGAVVFEGAPARPAKPLWQGLAPVSALALGVYLLLVVFWARRMNSPARKLV